MFRRPRSGRGRARRGHTTGISFLRPRQPRFEPLEERRLLAVFTVINTNDAGAGSLRQAIIDANNMANVGGVPDEIHFDIPGGGVQTIQPTSELDAITEAVIVDGYTQPGASSNTFSGTLNTTLTIELDGQSAGAGADGLQIDAGGNGSTIRGLTINRFSENGVHIVGSDNNSIVGNFIGTDVTGSADLGNEIDGVAIEGDSDGNMVGGAMPALRNLISGNNSDGVQISDADASGNMVQGNLIGLAADGVTDRGNAEVGVRINAGTTDNLVGGTASGARNIISGNEADGVGISGNGTTGNTIAGNYIGTTSTGNASAGNGSDGVEIGSGAMNNTVGGTTTAARNIISGNADDGVDIFGAGTTGNMILGNFIGTSTTGTGAIGNSDQGVEISADATNNVVGGAADGAGNTIAFNGSNGVAILSDGSTGNRIQRNSIRNNDELGIDLGDDGVTPNDAGDPDAGPNLIQNFPVFVGGATLLGDSIALRYLVDSVPNANATYPLTVEFFVADSDNQEGRTFLAADTYVAGEAQMTKMITIPAPPVLTNARLVATATDANGNTSEFSAPVALSPPRFLGSEPTVILPSEQITEGEVDYFQYIAHSTGKLVVRIDFLHEFGDLALEVRDQFGNLLAMSDSSTADQNFEEVILPVVAQEKYFISVITVDFGDEQTNFYALEVENFPAPVPTGVHLDPASDTGMMNNDNVTSDTTPTFFIQTDVLQFVDENENGTADASEINVLTAAEAEAGMTEGIAVEVTLVNTTTAMSITGFADPLIATIPEVYTFTAPELQPGVYLVTARTKIFDGQEDEAGMPDPAMGRSTASPPLWITISADSPVGGTFDLLPSSDTGMFNDDNVTNKMQPAFSGQGPANAKVHVFAQPTDTTGTPVGDPLLVGEGVVGSDATDGIPDNGLGLWEVTVEPMADGKYNFFARFETAAGILGDPVALTTTATYTDGPNVIPDGGMLTTQVTVPAGAMPLPIIDVNVRINVMHSNDQDLVITLIAPDATEILLTSNNGGNGDNYTNTIFDDAAGISITAGVAPFTGTFRPEVALAGLNGKEASGDWMLRIVDDTMNESEGMLIDWSLTIQTPLMVVIDTVEPNTPYLDLLDDTGRSDADNITKDNTPMVSMTTSDPNIAFSQLLFTDNLKFRIFDRFEDSAQEVLIYDSAQDVDADNIMTPNDMFTALTQITRTLPVLTPVSPAITAGGQLADGVHNLKLEVEDRAGNISHDFLLTITVDTVTPPVSFGLPAAASQIDGLTAESDTGVTTMPMTYADRVTSDTTPRMWGRAEADTIVRLYFDQNANGVIDLLTDTFLGQTVAVPYDGNDAYPDGYWEITSSLDLNEIVGLPKDGLRRLLVTAEDVAGNPMPMDNQISDGVDELQIFIDTQGPQITDVTVTDVPSYDLFDPKPSTNGYTPLVTSLSIDFRDLPNRLDQAVNINDFLYEALKEDIALAPGNYMLVGDHVGAVAIQSILVTNDPRTNGNPATATVELTFFEALPDDRYTLTVKDNLVDPAGNKLDGESHAAEPQEDPNFPTGDGVPGGNFVARFTIDSRPEIANYVPQQINIDINGNFIWDPGSVPIGGDATNVDISFTLPVQNAGGTVGPGGYNVHDLLFAGKFFQPNGVITRHFDQLAAYGFSSELGVFRWIIDTNSDGVVTLGTDIATAQPTLANFNVSGAIPVAGNFDNNAANGDEIGLYNAGKWFLDTNHDFVIGGGDTLITTNLLGHPVAGDFDGDGLDDLAVFNNNILSFNLANDGFGDGIDATITWGFPGVLDRPIAADMDQDGIDDIGLWVPRSDATLPNGVAQWYFLISNDFTAPGVPAVHTPGSIANINHAFTPTPFGHDIFAEFGDQLSLPVVGNFDPPIAASSVNSSLAGDYDGNGRVEQADAMVWRASFGSTTDMAADGNHNGVIDTGDYIVWRKNLGAVAASGSSVSALSVAASADPLAGWTIGDASGDEVIIIVSDSLTQQSSTTGVVAVDDFFAQLDGAGSDGGSADTLSVEAAVWEDDDLLLTTLSTSSGSETVLTSTPDLTGDNDVDGELVDELLTELAGVGAAFDSL